MLGLISIVGGIYAIQRKEWRKTIILTMVSIPLILTIFSSILIGGARKEFSSSKSGTGSLQWIKNICTSLRRDFKDSGNRLITIAVLCVFGIALLSVIIYLFEVFTSESSSIEILRVASIVYITIGLLVAVIAASNSEFKGHTWQYIYIGLLVLLWVPVLILWLYLLINRSRRDFP